MTNCAIIDPDGNIVGVIVADPATDKPYDGHSLIPIPDGVHVDHTWHHSHDKGLHLTDSEYERKHPVPTLPAWNDNAQPFTFETSTKDVLDIARCRIKALQASRGRDNFDPDKECPAFTWASRVQQTSPNCAAFCARISEGLKTKEIQPDWAVDWLIAQCTLLPSQLLKIIVDALPAHQARLARRYISAQGVSV